MLKMMTFLTGDDYQLVKQSDPKSRKKVAITGTLLLVPTLLWLVNGILITHVVLAKSLELGITVGIGCGAVIFILERALLQLKSGWANLFRIGLGLLVAVLGSIGWDEVLFDGDITNHMSSYKERQKNTYLEDGNEAEELEIDQQEKMVADKYQVWEDANTTAIKEADGTGGSGQRGISDITRLKQKDAEKYEQEYQRELANLEIMKTSLADKKAEAEQEFEAKFNEHSLLTRIKVLFDMVKEDTFMLIIYALITFFLIFLEFLVIIYKLFSGTTAYEYRLEEMEKVAMRRIGMLSNFNQDRFDPVHHDPKYQQIKKMVGRGVPEVF